MLTEQEAQDMMNKLYSLRKEALNNSEIKKELDKHERICIEKFKYLVTMKTGKYKSFNNFDDLNQEGYLALVTAMKNYNPSLGSFFWWAHKYIDTRISRSANLHTTIRYPLKVAKNTTPHKETIMPIIIE
jgi:DNA-directed RNA polymerase specialized sigma subunit